MIDKDVNHGRLYIYSKNLVDFLNWMYKDSKICLNRKHKLYNLLLEKEL